MRLSLFSIAALAVAAASAASSASAAPSQDLLKRCSVKNPATGELYIPEQNFSALARILADDTLAKYGKGCRTALTGEERAQLEADQKLQLDDLKTIKKQHEKETPKPGISLDVASQSLGVKPKEPSYPIVIRNVSSVNSIAALVKAQNTADGATFSYTRDFEKDNVLTSLTGAVFGYYDVVAGRTEKEREKIAPFEHIIFAPGIEFDEERNRASSSKNVDSLTLHMLSEFMVPGEASFHHLIRFGGDLNTDSKGQSKLWTGYAEWQPLSNVYGISSGHPLYHNAPIAYQFDPILHAEAEKVAYAGALTNVRDGDYYYRFGPILAANFWFTDGPAQLMALTFSAQYRQLWGTANSGDQKDVHYWQFSSAYNLDPDGHAAVTATYRQGDLPTTGQEVRDFKMGLAVKY
jgi:hypothetical protein